MFKAALPVALTIAAIVAPPPVHACPGPSAEKYMVWPDVPELLDGEVAIEIDMQDFFSQRANARETIYKVKRVLAGYYEVAVVAVRENRGGCSHRVSGGAFRKLVLVGRIERPVAGPPYLVPRYMAWDHPLREAAARLAEKP